jgi:hypothetical protein
MSQLDRLEELAQRLVEGTFSRFFQADKNSPPPPPTHATPTETREVLRLAGGISQAKSWALWVAGNRLPLGEPVVTVGRALDNDIVLTEPTVSRYHAQLRWRNGGYVLCPPDAPSGPASVPTERMGSAPHTRVNGQSPATEQPLAAGDQLEFGQTGITVEVQ